MSYNGSGTFTVLSSFTSGTTISSSAMNALLADIASGLSNAVCKDGQSSITGQIAVASGTVSAPGLAFGSDTDCGLYRIGANDIGLAIGGAKVAEFTSAGALDANGNPYAAFPSGTVMLFMQTSAPTGWTKSTTHNDKALRIVSGTASSGGTSPFSTVFGLTATSSYTLTSTDIPAHTHSFSATSGGQSATHTHSGTTSTDGAHVHAMSGNISSNTPGSSVSMVQAQSTGAGSANTESGGAHTHTMTTGVGSADHTHSVSGTTGSTGSGGGHTHPIELRVQYADVIAATKD